MAARGVRADPNPGGGWRAEDRGRWAAEGRGEGGGRQGGGAGRSGAQGAAHVVDAELEDASDAFLLQAAEDAALAQGHVHAAVAVRRLGELTRRGQHELAWVGLG